MRLINHGTTTGYNNGCRCEECRDAVRRYRKDLQAKPVPDHLHGTVGAYNNHRCRCDACKAAWKDEVARQRAKRIAAGVVPEHVHGTRNGYDAYRCRCEPCMEANRICNRDYYARHQSAAARGSLRGKVCINGHDLVPENMYPRKDGKKACKACIRDRDRRWREKKKQNA